LLIFKECMGLLNLGINAAKTILAIELELTDHQQMS